MRLKFGRWTGLAAAMAIACVMPGCGNSPKDAQKPDRTRSTAQRPDEAVRDLLAGLSEGDSSVLWSSLPKRYQVETTSIVREFAGKMDQQVWDRTFHIARRIVKLLRTRKKLILENPELRIRSLNTKLVSENWYLVIDLLETLVDSELADLDKLRAFDGGEFFKGTGSRLLVQLIRLSAQTPKDPYGRGLSADVRLVELDGDKATVGLKTGNGVSGDDEETMLKVNRIDGEWMIEELEFGLKLLFASGRELVDTIPDGVITKNRTALLTLLQTVEEDLDRIELAKTNKQFNQALLLAQVRLRQLIAAGTEDEPDDEPSGPNDGRRTVTIVIEGPISDATRRDIVTRLEKITRANGAAMVKTRKDSTRIVIPSRRFLQDVIDEIDFGTVSKVDGVRRIVTVKSR